ncbi:MAG: imidazole glycerol phosphate synthase subunit HisH [Candidatus Faecousia sp.]|nr:imidazole glycerol phosphate synthase subunit HisH [Candidatus Faecousia sp.]
MIAIVDYGVGNLFSLKCSLQAIGAEVTVTGDAQTLKRAGKLILPGVGAFEDAAKKLRDTGLDTVIKEEAARGKPILGICLGMQLLFEKSYEYGEHPGLGLIPGSVVPMEGLLPRELKIPHIGWNALRIKKSSPLFRRIADGDCVYFVHSYFAAHCEDFVIAGTEYGQWLTAAVQRENVFGCQFHPEKSGAVGLNILRAFAEMEELPC